MDIGNEHLLDAIMYMYGSNYLILLCQTTGWGYLKRTKTEVLAVPYIVLRTKGVIDWVWHEETRSSSQFNHVTGIRVVLKWRGLMELHTPSSYHKKQLHVLLSSFVHAYSAKGLDVTLQHFARLSQLVCIHSARGNLVRCWRRTVWVHVRCSAQEQTTD